jgi:hypothetical protein
MLTMLGRQLDKLFDLVRFAALAVPLAVFALYMASILDEMESPA